MSGLLDLVAVLVAVGVAVALAVFVLDNYTPPDPAPYGRCQCGGIWKVRNGRHGQFLGCSNYRHGTCDRTRDLP